MARYHATAKGIDFYKFLEDPSGMSAWQRQANEARRARMTERDWAMQQIVVCLRTGPGSDADPDSVGVTVKEMLELALMCWTDGVDRGLRSGRIPSSHHLYHQAYHTRELFDELLRRGFIAAAP